MTPWQCYCKPVQIFLPNLNFSCKESASKCIDFGPQMRRLNSETISICGGIWGDFWELLERLSFAKEIALKNLAWESLLKLTIKGIVWWCASIKMAGFAITSFRSRDFPPSFLKSFYDISISLCMNELFVAACC